MCLCRMVPLEVVFLHAVFHARRRPQVPFPCISARMLPQQFRRLTPGFSGCRKRERRTSGWSGKEAVSPSPPPLRTARASFPACRSSRLTGSDALSVSLTMTYCVEPLEVRAFITSPGVYREEVMEVDLLSIEQGLSTPRTLPTLGFG
jgi:hypothetical protein